MAHSGDAPAGNAGAFRPGSLRGMAGFFRIGQDADGRWWLIDPQGTPCFLRSVHGVHPPATHLDGSLPCDAAIRVRTWGFNSVGIGTTPDLWDDGLPFLASVDFAPAAKGIVAPGVRLPDVFDPEWPRMLAERARDVCPPFAVHHGLIGWVTDDGLDWATPTSAGRPSLLQICLSLEPSFAAYHAAWEFVLAPHGGQLDRLAHAWNATIPNKEVVRELTRAEEGLGTRGYLRDEARWVREFARRYFNDTANAIRRVDPNHLVLGCRFRGFAGAAVLAECVYPAVDVCLRPWNELPPANAESALPIIADDVCWAAAEFLRAPAGPSPARLTTVERMLRRARRGLSRLARHPAVIGYAWSAWQDEPGEQPPFGRGLLHANGAEAREHTELLSQFNSRAEALHRESGQSLLDT